jgi:aspartyl/asparaginyl-tRNA synthetase
MVGELANHPQALAENHAELPNIPKQGIPIISFEDAMEMVKNDPNNPGIITFNRIAEGIVAKFVKEKTDSDFYYIIGFPADEKPFYVDLADADTTYSFDLVYRGVEISSGGLRINDPALLRERLRVKGFTDLRQFKDYFDVFERGSIQTGGFGLGLERFVANSLGGLNVRLTTLFPKTAKTAIG